MATINRAAWGKRLGEQMALIVPRHGGEYPAPLYAGAPPAAPTVTSHVAAQQIKRPSAGLRAQVLSALQAEPRTCEELEAALGLPHQTCGPRIRELALLGHVRDSGARRLTRSGREAIVWHAALDGPSGTL